MTTNHNYKAVLPNGEIITRRSARTYTHVVLVREVTGTARARLVARLAAERRNTHRTAHPDYHRAVRETIKHLQDKLANFVEVEIEPGPWQLEGWAGRPDLAESLASAARNRGYEVMILEATK